MAFSYLPSLPFTYQIGSSSIRLNTLVCTFLFFVVVVASQEIPSNSPSSKPGVYALPEINLKLRNGTQLETVSNFPVKLSKELGYVQLTCTADYPVKWEYLVKDKTIPVLDVVYRRLIKNTSDFNNSKTSRFASTITLRGLLQSQTGKYLCRLYNEKLSNNSYAVASYFDIFIPGNRTFNSITSVSFMNKTAEYVNIHCPSTDPDLHVRLYKLNEQEYKRTKAVVWKPIYSNYEPTDGFTLLAGLGRELLGTYNCTADNGASVIYVVADLAEKEHYQSLSPTLYISINSSCWETPKVMQYFRSRRLECYCKDSFGLFMNDNFDYENRKANCSSEALSQLALQISNCSDWRVDEFIRNQEESPDVCFRDRVTEKFLGDGGDDGTGSRPSIKVRGKTFPNGDDQRNFPFTKLNITYNGFVDWAGDFRVAVCRRVVCFPGNKKDSVNMTGTDLEYLENESLKRQYFPLAHHQAVWNDLIINGTDVEFVYVLQAHSLSYAWFPYATADITWEQKTESSTDQDQSSVEGSQMMSSAVSSRLQVYKLMSWCTTVLIALLVA